FGMGLKTGSLPTDNTLKMVRNPPSSNQHSRMFDKLLGNTEFRNFFINRYADLLNTAYHINNIKLHTAALKGSIEAEMPRHVARWDYGLTAWHESIDYLIDFSEQRVGYARQQVQDEFGLLKQVIVTLNVVPSEAGRIQINTIIPDSVPWTGIYYDGVPVTITAFGNPGYDFSFWSQNALITDVGNAEQIINLSSEETFTANFIWTNVREEENSPFTLTLSPNPSKENMQVDIVLRDDIYLPYLVEIVANDGRVIKQWNFEGNQKFMLQRENFTSGLHLIRISSENFSVIKKLIFH
ncbi:MAG: CotH kinase family protein, partial [Bacteroidetes bacterium]|nr:CotH kinase family protein [Bacteroidota bacterium]